MPLLLISCNNDYAPYKEVAKGTSVVLFGPAIAKVFPTSEAEMRRQWSNCAQR